MRFGKFLLVAVLAAPLTLSAALAADLVVIKSTVPGIDPGSVIDGAQKMTLRAGSQLSLIGANGRVVTLSGPYEGVPAPADEGRSSSLVDALAVLVSGQKQDQRTLGTIRSAAAERSRAPLFIDITANGPQCVVAGQPVTLWQPSGEAVLSLKVTRVAPNQSATLNWPVSSAVAPWPTSVPVADGGEYEVTRLPANTTTKVTLQVVGGDLPTDAHRSAAFSERGCTVQALALLTAP